MVDVRRSGRVAVGTQGDACVVDEDVDPAAERVELGGTGSSRSVRVPRSSTATTGSWASDAATTSSSSRAGNEGDTPGGVERHRDRRTDPPPGTGDDRRASVERAHHPNWRREIAG
ncbi:MAG: hypothetical protein WKF45_02230 [Ilumatobacteraceae bacterium]